MKIKISYSAFFISMLMIGMVNAAIADVAYISIPPIEEDTTGALLETPYPDKKNKLKINVKSYKNITLKDSGILKLPVNQPVIPNKIKSESAPKPLDTSKSHVPEKAQQAKPDDDSILSFNFLYYIIEKYKLQDIID